MLRSLVIAEEKVNKQFGNLLDSLQRKNRCREPDSSVKKSRKICLTSTLR